MSKSHAAREDALTVAAKAKRKGEECLGSWATHAGLRHSKVTKVPLARAPLPMARRFMLIATAIWTEACAEESLDHLEFGVLGMLGHKPDADRNLLAAAVGVDRTNIGVIIERLEARNFLERTVDPEDRRVQRMCVTSAGKRAYRDQKGRTAIAREKILGPLSANEREKLYDLLEKVIAANERYAIPGAGRRKRRR